MAMFSGLIIVPVLTKVIVRSVLDDDDNEPEHLVLFGFFVAPLIIAFFCGLKYEINVPSAFFLG